MDNGFNHGSVKVLIIMVTCITILDMHYVHMQEDKLHHNVGGTITTTQLKKKKIK